MHRRCTCRRALLKAFYTRENSWRSLRRISTTPSVQVIQQTSGVDPFALVEPHLSTVRSSLVSILASGHPSITEITKYYFLHPAKHVRPAIVILLAQATNGLGEGWAKKLKEAREDGANALDKPLTRPDVLNDWNPLKPNETANFDQAWSLHEDRSCSRAPSPSSSPPHPLSTPLPVNDGYASPIPKLSNTVLPSQLRLAQIVEMLHTASLLHDDVIDESSLRRGAPSAPAAFGNKLSVLGGNFVLGRASAALARLGEPEVTQLIAAVLSNLVEGEILQMKDVKLHNGEGSSASQVDSQTAQDAWNIYLQKTYLKTASLMAKGARAAVVLGGCKEGEPWKEIAYAYGRNLGIAFQVGFIVISAPSILTGRAAC